MSMFLQVINARKNNAADINDKVKIFTISNRPATFLNNALKLNSFNVLVWVESRSADI